MGYLLRYATQVKLAMQVSLGGILKRSELKRKTPMKGGKRLRPRRPRREGGIKPDPPRNFPHMLLVKALACRVKGCQEPAEAHHIREGYGRGQRASDLETIPLCRRHHREGGRCEALHQGRRFWQEVHGTELFHLGETLKLLGLTFDDVVAFRGSEPPWWSKLKAEADAQPEVEGPAAASLGRGPNLYHSCLEPQKA